MDHVQGDRGRMLEERRALFQRCRGIDPAMVARDAGITVTRKGNRNYCLCPFHAEGTPSLLLDERGSWHCFGCGEGGDVFSFIMKTEDFNFPEAVRYLADRARD